MNEVGTVREHLVTILRMGLLGSAGVLAFVALLGERSDYAGHFIAGYGGTLGLAGLPLATLGPPLRREPLLLALVAIAIGAILEATVFRIAQFDPVDFFNQSLGAALAGIAVLGRPRAVLPALAAFLFALAFLSLGTRLAFA